MACFDDRKFFVIFWGMYHRVLQISGSPPPEEKGDLTSWIVGGIILYGDFEINRREFSTWKISKRTPELKNILHFKRLICSRVGLMLKSILCVWPSHSQVGWSLYDFVFVWFPPACNTMPSIIGLTKYWFCTSDQW